MREREKERERERERRSRNRKTSWMTRPGRYSSWSR